MTAHVLLECGVDRRLPSPLICTDIQRPLEHCMQCQSLLWHSIKSLDTLRWSHGSSQRGLQKCSSRGSPPFTDTFAIFFDFRCEHSLSYCRQSCGGPACILKHFSHASLLTFALVKNTRMPECPDPLVLKPIVPHPATSPGDVPLTVQ